MRWALTQYMSLLKGEDLDTKAHTHTRITPWEDWNYAAMSHINLERVLEGVFLSHLQRGHGPARHLTSDFQPPRCETVNFHSQPTSLLLWQELGNEYKDWGAITGGEEGKGAPSPGEEVGTWGGVCCYSRRCTRTGRVGLWGQDCPDQDVSQFQSHCSAG